MKKRILSMFLSAVFGITLMATAAQASLSANILYTETDLGNGSWKYDFVFQNTSPGDASHPYLQSVKLDFDYSTVTMSNTPANWTSYTYTGPASIGTPVDTDYLEMYSVAKSADVAAGSSLGGFSFTTTGYSAGNIAYTAIFSDHAESGENFETAEGTATPTPIPAAFWLLGSGLAGLAGIRRKQAVSAI